MGKIFTEALVRFKRALQIIFLSCLWVAGAAFSITNPGQLARLENETINKARLKVEPILERYCGKFCQLIDIGVEIEEEVAANDDIGFESAVQTGAASSLYVKKVIATVQIDSRVSMTNRERLNKILEVNLQPLGVESVVDWQVVTLPDMVNFDVEDPNRDEADKPLTVNQTLTYAEQYRTRLENDLRSALNRVINQYCPDQCIVEQIEIMGDVEHAKAALGLSKSRLVQEKGSSHVFRVDNVDIDVTMDDALAVDARNRITALMRAKTRFVSPVNINVSVTPFPETYQDMRQKALSESQDPYGLEKLRRMLVMFRDLAGTKEVITKSESQLTDRSEAVSTNTETSSARTDSTSSSTATDSSTTKSNTSSLETQGGFDSLTTEEIAAYLAGFILLLTLMVIIILKFARANRDARAMMIAQGRGGVRSGVSAQAGEDEWAVGGGDAAGETPAKVVAPEERSMNLLLRIRELKDELIELFMENPRVAKETFSRFLKEDGVEETAKYVHVFGHMIVFELLDDPNYQRDLYELSEYYHNSSFHFMPQEEHDLLVKLKTRCTASEIRVMAHKNSEKFDFLAKLDAQQIYNLIIDEKVQVQTIVLAQLDRKRRRAVFDMYEGPTKISLMSQLSMAETIPKDYLYNVAKALSKKVTSRPEFDTENLRSSDILLDLLEKANLQEQRQLMSTLSASNPETARTLKLRLVTIEMMPYLKDGHLLELILGMEREDLLTFLVAAPEHIRELMLRKAPSELSESWLEDMEAMSSVDEQAYRRVEMQILSRIRNFSNNGVISLLDINTMIFDQGSKDSQFIEHEALPHINRGVVAA